MLFVAITFITALAISAVAIFYSVAGLMTIFAAAAIPIMIMGGVLEIGKLVTAVWLHRYWDEAVWWLKVYLTAAVIILMAITSTGIFGFLSRAHIEQTAGTTEVAQIVLRLESELERLDGVIARAETTIATTESRTGNQSENLQTQIDREQERIEGAYSRIQPELDRQIALIARAETRGGEGLVSQLETLDDKLESLESALLIDDVLIVQGIVGVRQDGAFGPATRTAVQSFRETQQQNRAALLQQLDELRAEPNPDIERAEEEIRRLRGLSEQEIADSNVLISRLRGQLGQDDSESIAVIIEDQTQIIMAARNDAAVIRDEKFQMEVNQRMLEAEVGPIKYIAEFIYGETDRDILEEAVRWMIFIIIIVFDPLAVLLLIASQYAYGLHYRNKTKIINSDNEKTNTRVVKDATDANRSNTNEFDRHFVRLNRKE